MSCRFIESEELICDADVEEIMKDGLKLDAAGCPILSEGQNLRIILPAASAAEELGGDDEIPGTSASAEKEIEREVSLADEQLNEQEDTVDMVVDGGIAELREDFEERQKEEDTRAVAEALERVDVSELPPGDMRRKIGRLPDRPEGDLRRHLV